MGRIADVTHLESVVGRRSSPVMMKTIDHLDAHCAALLARAPAAVLGYVGADGSRAAVVGGEPGFALADGPSRLRLPAPPDARSGTGAALLVLIPGWRETLRINGLLHDDHLAVDEAFLHCGKAVIRSQLWAPPTASDDDRTVDAPSIPPAAAAFLPTATFAVVMSRDGAGRADASPKGDPPGVVRVLGPTTVALADRPGNRRTDTFHNLLDDPGVALTVMTPGDDRVLELVGSAGIRTEPELREPLAERGRVPKAVLVVEVERSRLHRSAAVVDARLWDRDRHVDPADLPRPSRIWSDHVRLNGSRGITARLVRATAGDRLLNTTIEQDYRRNLY